MSWCVTVGPFWCIVLLSVCCSVLQRVAVWQFWCSVLQTVAISQKSALSVLQCVAAVVTGHSQFGGEKIECQCVAALVIGSSHFGCEPN